MLSQKLDEQFFKANPPVCESGLYSVEREITGVFSLDPGNYVVVPSCFSIIKILGTSLGEEDGEFYLRVFVETDLKKDE